MPNRTTLRVTVCVCTCARVASSGRFGKSAPCSTISRHSGASVRARVSRAHVAELHHIARSAEYFHSWRDGRVTRACAPNRKRRPRTCRQAVRQISRSSSPSRWANGPCAHTDIKCDHPYLLTTTAIQPPQHPTYTHSKRARANISLISFN